MTDLTTLIKQRGVLKAQLTSFAKFVMLEPGVAYSSSSEDYVFGFQSNSTTDFCDHALVFMAMGVCKKWKQPVAYYFSKGGVGSTKLKQYLTEVIVAIQNVGLRIVATVCDQFQSNCKVYTCWNQE
ncbi:Transposase protein [Popillia japonica]|uniref:Transposase protein n=1 Tax=Popillia japonica TaxID=7064 RepID=A0AAW1L5K7_POPJA